MVIAEITEARMLEKAQQDGVTLERQADGRFYTRSAKTPAGRFYITTAESCSCQGFQTHGHCKHNARVKAICPFCDGMGKRFYPVRITSEGKTVYAWYSCGACT